MPVPAHADLAVAAASQTNVEKEYLEGKVGNILGKNKVPVI